MTATPTRTPVGATSTLQLPRLGGGTYSHRVRGRSAVFDDAALTTGATPSSRSVYAAGHVVANPLADPADRGGAAAIDWDATMAFRRHLWSLGLGLAEAMDTAQRGGGLDWTLARRLIRT